MPGAVTNNPIYEADLALLSPWQEAVGSVSDLRSTMTIAFRTDNQPNLRITGGLKYLKQETQFLPPEGDSIDEMLQQPHFVSYLSNGTNTGLLRAATLRLNPSVSCSPLTEGQFPALCGGEHSFERSVGGL